MPPQTALTFPAALNKTHSSAVTPRPGVLDVFHLLIPFDCCTLVSLHLLFFFYVLKNQMEAGKILLVFVCFCFFAEFF